MRESTRKHFRQVESLPEPTQAPASSGKVRIAVLASGSKGNCILLAHGDRAILIDAGITPEDAARRARSVGMALTRLDAVVLTHWHKDHSKCVTDFCRSFACGMVSSKSTQTGLDAVPGKCLPSTPGEPREVGPFTLHAIKVDHEEGSLVFHIHVAGKNIVVAHDLGQPNSTLFAAVRAADAVLIESNYDSEMLAACANPNHNAELHARLPAGKGHLSNQQAGEVLSHVDPDKIQVVCALHLSSSHNTEAAAEGAMRYALPPGAHPQIYTAHQDSAILLEVNGGPQKIELPLIDQFRRLDRKVDAIINEQKRADQETAERRVLMGELLIEGREIFAQKEPEDKLDGFQFFDDWKIAKAHSYGVSERTMNYYLLDTETVVPRIGREVAIALPLGTIAELGKLAKAKGDIPAATLQFAQEHSATEVKAHVASILYPGKTGHFDGPEEHFTVTAGKAQIKIIRQKLDAAREYVSDNAPDGDVIEYALEEFIQAHQNAEIVPDEMSSPVPPPPDWFSEVAEAE